VQKTVLGVVTTVALAVAALAGCGDDDDASTTTAGSTATTTVTSAASSSDDTDGTGSSVSAADATEADYLAAIERSLSTGDGLTTSSEQAECMAPKWLDTVGIDRLKEHAIAPSQIGDDVNDDGSALSDLGLTSDEGNALYDAFDECDVDIQQKFVDFVTEGQSAEVVTCVADALTPDLLRRLMVSSIVEAQPDDELQAEFEAAVGPCDELGQASTTTAA